MSWHIRFFSPSLKHELLSPEMATEQEALEEALNLARRGEDVTAIEGPDGEILSAEEIDLWFRERGHVAAPNSDDQNG